MGGLTRGFSTDRPLDERTRHVEAQPASSLEQKGELLSALTRELIGLHKRFYGRGATKAKALFAHENLLLVEMENVFLTMEHTMVSRGQLDIVRQARRTFQSAM